MMIDRNKQYGLCCTCNHRCDCLSLRNSLRAGIPILHCEEFDDFVAGLDGMRFRKKPKKLFLQNTASNIPHSFKFGLEA
jgi:hypothetical protein